MRDPELILAAAAFIRADLEYVKLLERTADFKDKRARGISDQELRALRDAKARKATLEEQMYLVLEDCRIEF